MPTKVSPRKTFETRLEAHLRALAAPLEVELASLASEPRSKDTRFFLIEYDSPHFAERFAVRIWPMDRRGTPTGEGRPLLAAKAKATVVPPALYADERYEALEPWQLASKHLEAWLLARWKRVGAKFEPHPGVLGHHDSYFKIDLRTGQRVNWDQVLEAARKTR